jgi:hypothetical protein
VISKWANALRGAGAPPAHEPGISIEEEILTETGVFMTVPVMTTALVSEQLVHGLDIARALRHPWPIERDDALLVIAGTARTEFRTSVAIPSSSATARQAAPCSSLAM